MGYIVAIIFLAVCISERVLHKTWVAPSVMFSGFWAVISFFAALRLFNLNSVETKTWMVLITGVISFVLGTKFLFRSRRNNSGNMQAGTAAHYIPLRVFWIVLAIVGINLLREIAQTLRLLQANVALSDIRKASFGIITLEGYTYETGANANFLRHLFSAVETILIAIGIDLYFRSTKKNLKYLLASISLVVGEAFSAGGRWVLVYFVVELFVCRSMLSSGGLARKINAFVRKRRKGALLTLLVIIGITVTFFQITAGRDILNVGQSLYSYLCGCVALLDLKIKDIDQSRIYSYFLAGQYGLWCFLMPFLRRITGYNFPLYYDTTLKHVMTGQQFRNIGSASFNAFTTGFYYQYADFRFVGVFVGMFVSGIIAGNLFRNAKRNRSSYAMVPYLVVSQMLVQSIQNCMFGSADNVFALILMVIVYFFMKYKPIRIKDAG